MFIYNLSLVNFRNYIKQDVSFSNNINLLIGENAQGKTNIIEALNFILHGKSRAIKDSSLINYKAQKAFLIGNFVNDEYKTMASVEISDKSNFYVNNNKNKTKGIFEEINTVSVLFSPDDLVLIKEGPEHRRNYLDNLIIFLWPKQKYIRINYFKSLKNRNMLLKSYQIKENLNKNLDIWDKQLIKYGSSLLLARAKLLEILKQKASVILKELEGGNEDIQISYKSTTCQDIAQNTEEIFDNKLKENRRKDIEFQTTLIGPHRDDLLININGKNSREYCSQGQQRTLAIMLKIAQLQTIRENTQYETVLLLDDVLSELDEKRKNCLLGLIDKDIQTIITSTTIDDLHDLKNEAKVFRVRNGEIFETN